MQDERLTFLFQQYINKQCTRAEYAEFMLLINEAGKDGLLKELLDDYYNGSPADTKLPANRAGEIFKNIIDSDPGNYTQPSFYKIKAFQAWAAAVLVVLSISTLFYLNNRTGTHKVKFAQFKSDTTRKLIKLADGSTVILNRHSSIQYPLTFKGKTREVVLTGEGYFDIAHDKQKPFIVHTGKLTVTVLGTAFNIRANPEDKNVTVMVTRGKVSVSNNKGVLAVITPNQQITYDKTSNSSIRNELTVKQAAEWYNKDLFFDDVTMSDAADLLEKQFDVKINFSNEQIKNCRFTGTFLYGEKLEQVLKVICSFNNAVYETKQNGEIMISGPGCN
jgi:transmembrane sensor